MKIIKIIAFTNLIFVLAVSCVSPEEWSDKYESIVPDPVSNVQVENVNGGAIISYVLPNVKDLRGAKVVYSLTPDGEEIERWASAESDTIVLEGFGDTDERTVVLYSVHKSGNISVGVPVTIKPLTPPIFLIRETLKAEGAFGGIQVTWKNPDRTNMGVTLYAEDSITHELVVFDKYYSNAQNGKVIFRSFDPKEQQFRIEMFDRWLNYADNLEATILPLVEEEIMGLSPLNVQIWTLFDDGRVDMNDASSTWRYYYRCDIHTDIDNPAYAPQSFDLVVGRWNSSNWFPGGSNPPLSNYVPGESSAILPLPVYITFDMGMEAVYSRMQFQVNPRAPIFSEPPYAEFDVWGTNNPKTIEEVEDPNGIYPKGSREANQAYWSSWKVCNGTDAWKNDWVKLGSFVYMLSIGTNQYFENINLQMTAEEIAQYQTLGYEFEFNESIMTPYRYLRWEIKKSGNPAIFPYSPRLRGLRYWGAYPK